jgi:hypothetical protein
MLSSIFWNTNIKDYKKGRNKYIYIKNTKMHNLKENIDKIISKILNEEISHKADDMSGKLMEKGEWTEIFIDEELFGNQHKLDVAKPKGKLTSADFKKLRGETEEEECMECGDGYMEEAETEEGNAFSGALALAKEKGEDSFEVDGKKYHVKEGKEKWIQKTKMKKGSLHKKLNVPEDEKIPQDKLKSLKKELTKKAEGDKKLNASDSKLLKQVNLALTLGSLKENKNSLHLSEEELIDLIEKIVLEEKNKSNIKNEKAEGLKKTEKVLKADKKENDDYAREVVEKMKEYVKHGSVGEFNEDTDQFPQSNYTLGKMKAKTMKYHPSDAVDEYIEAFAFPGMTNLVYDEIKPDEEMIEKYLKGHRTTGNAEVDEEGVALGNVVPSKVGDKFMKNFKENLYGAEQMEVSYKRYPQDTIEVAGHNKKNGKLNSLKKNSKIFNALESVEEKNKIKINEDLEKMKNLISYNSKTQ